MSQVKDKAEARGLAIAFFVVMAVLVLLGAALDISALKGLPWIK
jgi:hypothetical protein